MADYVSNIWLITEEEFDAFTTTGGKVIYIAEDTSKYTSHPAIVTAGILLPPFESIQAELDGLMERSIFLYSEYLKTDSPANYIMVLLAAAIQQVPIGIMFGRDELNMQFPKVLMDILFNTYGIVVGVSGKVPSYIVEQFMPNNLAHLYNEDIIDLQTFMSLHPNMPISGFAIYKLAMEIKPPIKPDEKAIGYLKCDIEEASRYIEEIRKAAFNNGGKMLINPMEGIW